MVGQAKLGVDMSREVAGGTAQRAAELRTRGDAYERSYRQQVRQAPVRHLLRSALYELRTLYDQVMVYPRAAQPAGYREFGSPLLRGPRHVYIGHRGPWIEEIFYQYMADKGSATGLIYLPVFWTNFYLYAQTSVIAPGKYRRMEQMIERVLDIVRRSSETFFTLIEYDHTPWDWHLFPKNLLVFSAGGGGDLAIPLLMRDRPYDTRPKDILCSFMGTLGGASDRGGLRSEMAGVFGDISHFGRGADWEDVMKRSKYTLCPRGLGPTSFRLFEALSCGSIPIFIWEGKRWLPYQDELDWGDIAIVTERDGMVAVRDAVAGEDPAAADPRLARIAELYPRYFTFAATCDYIRRWVNTHDGEDVRRITSRR